MTRTDADKTKIPRVLDLGEAAPAARLLRGRITLNPALGVPAFALATAGIAGYPKSASP